MSKVTLQPSSRILIGTERESGGLACRDGKQPLEGAVEADPGDRAVGGVAADLGDREVEPPRGGVPDRLLGAVGRGRERDPPAHRQVAGLLVDVDQRGERRAVGVVDDEQDAIAGVERELVCPQPGRAAGEGDVGDAVGSEVDRHDPAAGVAGKQPVARHGDAVGPRGVVAPGEPPEAGVDLPEEAVVPGVHHVDRRVGAVGEIVGLRRGVDPADVERDQRRARRGDGRDQGDRACRVTVIGAGGAVGTQQRAQHPDDGGSVARVPVTARHGVVLLLGARKPQSATEKVRAPIRKRNIDSAHCCVGGTLTWWSSRYVHDRACADDRLDAESDLTDERYRSLAFNVSGLAARSTIRIWAPTWRLRSHSMRDCGGTASSTIASSGPMCLHLTTSSERWAALRW